MDPLSLTRIGISILSGGISILTAVQGVKAANEVTEAIMKKMVAEGRPPTEDELMLVVDDVKARTERMERGASS